MCSIIRVLSQPHTHTHARTHTHAENVDNALQGYQTPLINNMDTLGVTDEDMLALFNNIEEIKDFNEYVSVCG